MDWHALRRRDFTDRQFNRLTIAILSLGFFALVLVIGAAGLVMLRSQDHTQWVNHTYEVEGAVAEFRLLIERTETGRRGYVLDHDPTILAGYQRNIAALGPAIDRFARLTADNARQRARIAPLRQAVAQLVATQRASLRYDSAASGDAALAGFRLDQALSPRARIERLTVAMLDEEHRLLGLRDADQRASVRLFYVVLGVAGLLLLIVAAAAIGIILRYTRDLTASRDELAQLNSSLEDVVAERTADLSRANAEIQRFAYIVSHDLRSPLVNVMGFTSELETATDAVGRLIDRAEREAPQIVDDQSRLAAKEDLPEAIRFIRSSTQKMDRLINAILQLSRQGRRVISAEPIDMSAAAHAIRDTLRHRIDEIGASLEIGALPDLVSDRLSVEQIFSNLMENALKYLQPGRPGRVQVRGRARDGRVVYEVEDNGRGIDPRDHERVFDLFRRSGVQDQPGEGIGLAHVRALAYRLGGTVDLRSRLGEGTTFILNLPARFAGETGAGQ